MDPTHLHFLIPDPETFPSGGNIYNAQLLTALAQKGLMIRRYFEWPLPPLPEEELLWVDTLFLDRFSTRQSKGRQCLIVHHLLSMEIGEELQRRKILQKERQQLTVFDGFLVTSDFTGDYLRQQLDLHQPIITVLPAVDLPLLPDVDLPTDGFKGILVANLIKRKGILPFLQVWSQKSWPRDFSLTIIGSHQLEPDYAEQCLRFVAQLPLNQQRQLVFLEGLSRMEIAQKYKEAAVFISTSTMETYGMAIQEAQAFGLPVLVIDGGYTARHIQSESNGFCFENPEDLVKKMYQLVEYPKALESWRKEVQKQNSNSIRTWSRAAEEFYEQVQYCFPAG